MKHTYYSLLLVCRIPFSLNFTGIFQGLKSQKIHMRSIVRFVQKHMTHSASFNYVNHTGRDIICIIFSWYCFNTSDMKACALPVGPGYRWGARIAWLTCNVLSDDNANSINQHTYSLTVWPQLPVFMLVCISEKEALKPPSNRSFWVKYKPKLHATLTLKYMHPGAPPRGNTVMNSLK